MLAFLNFKTNRTIPTVHNAWKATPSGTMQSSSITIQIYMIQVVDYQLMGRMEKRK